MEPIKKTYSALKGFYEDNPRTYSLLEIAVFLGYYFFNMWVTSFWFWGIYQMHLAVPAPVEKVFFLLWNGGTPIWIVSSILLVAFLVLTMIIRRDDPKDLGIRADNLWASGRECLVLSSVSLVIILVIFFFHRSDFDPHDPSTYVVGLLSYPIWGTIQQFILQSIFFVRLYRISGRKAVAIPVASIIFCLFHAPNVSLMILTLFAGLCLTFLFSRNRNIFTLGITHGVLAVLVHALLIPGVVTSLYVGPGGGDRHMVDDISYAGAPLAMAPGEETTIPVRIVNKSCDAWDPREEKHPVHASYHLLSETGGLLVYDTVRTPLKETVPPGETATIDLIVRAPKEPGRYLISVDLVKEGVDWFGNKGCPVIAIPMVVEGK